MYIKNQKTKKVNCLGLFLWNFHCNFDFFLYYQHFAKSYNKNEFLSISFREIKISITIISIRKIHWNSVICAIFSLNIQMTITKRGKKNRIRKQLWSYLGLFVCVLKICLMSWLSFSSDHLWKINNILTICKMII